MDKFLTSLGYITLGIVLGQCIRLYEVKKLRRTNDQLPKYLIIIRGIALFGLNPIITLSAFWLVVLDDIKLIALPIIGFSAMTLGGIISIIASRFLKHDRYQKGAMFVSGSFSNIGTFGGLINYAFFGEKSFAFVYMYKLLEEVYYYMIGYPIARSYSQSKKKSKSIFTDPFVVVYFSAIFIGCILNASGIRRPEVFGEINSILIPVVSVLMVTAVGYSMKFNKIRKYLKECLVVSGIKFIIIPVFVVTVATILGLHQIENGLVFKVLVVMSFMPTAFSSLIPPQIYGLDIDLANSCWLFTTGMLIFVLPVLALVLT